MSIRTLKAPVAIAILLTGMFVTAGLTPAIAAQLQQVFVTNDAAHAVPVQNSASNPLHVVSPGPAPEEMWAIHGEMHQWDYEGPYIYQSVPIPDGKQLLIQTISGRVWSPSDEGPADALTFKTDPVNGSGPEYFMPLYVSDSPFQLGMEQIDALAEDEFVVTLQTLTSHAEYQVDYTVSGILLDDPND